MPKYEIPNRQVFEYVDQIAGAVDGYCERLACGRDFLVRVVVEADVIRRLEPDVG